MQQNHAVQLFWISRVRCTTYIYEWDRRWYDEMCCCSKPSSDRCRTFWNKRQIASNKYVATLGLSFLVHPNYLATSRKSYTSPCLWSSCWRVRITGRGEEIKEAINQNTRLIKGVATVYRGVQVCFWSNDPVLIKENQYISFDHRALGNAVDIFLNTFCSIFFSAIPT